MVKEEFNLLYQFCSVLHGGLWSPYCFVISMERKHGRRSMIFYDTKVIPECKSRHSFSCFFLLSKSHSKPDYDIDIVSNFTQKKFFPNILGKNIYYYFFLIWKFLLRILKMSGYK